MSTPNDPQAASPLPAPSLDLAPYKKLVADCRRIGVSSSGVPWTKVGDDFEVLIAEIERLRLAVSRGYSAPLPASQGDEQTHLPSEGPFEFAWFCRHNGEPIRTVADVVETLALSAEKSTRAELWGVCLAERDDQGKQVVVCYTGNGPHSEANARLIARLLSDYRTTPPLGSSRTPPAQGNAP